MMIDQALAEQLSHYSPSTQPIRTQTFVLYMADKIYQNTQASLFQDHIILKLDQKKTSWLKINFNFDLIFDFQRTDDQKNGKTKLGQPYSIKFQRYNQSLTLKNSTVPAELFAWRDFLQKRLNQRGFHELFKPIKKVGKGNFASVYLVVKYQDGKKYAVKAFSKEGTYSQDKGKQSLINQIQIMRAVSHKNLMKLYQIYQSQNSIYINVELLQGGQLYEKIKNKYKFSMDQIKIVMKGILQGLQAMHKKNIMHRDLKPENILLRKDGDFDCVIADFGLATDADVDDYLFVRCGTPGYVAPQIVNLKDLKAKYTPVCDIFSLGVIFHLLTLRKSPFPGKQYDQVLSQNRACKFNYQASQYQKLPEQCLDLLKKMLEKDPKKRVTATQALNHGFFQKQNTSNCDSPLTNPNSGLRQRPPGLIIQRKNSNAQCDSPLMTTKNNARKQGRLRDDSCLKFKMKQNILTGKSEQSGQTIDSIDSPAVLSKKAPKNNQSRFKRMVQADE